MPETPKCLILRAVLLDVSPIVARVVAVPDDLALEELHEVLQLMLGWGGHLFYSFRVHGQEITQRRELRRKRLREFRFRRRETFLYTYSAVDLWEWELRVLDVEPGSGEGLPAQCVSGRGAAPPEDLGGPRAYMHFLDQEKYYLPMLAPELAEKAFERFASVLPDQGKRDLLREALAKGLERSAQRLVQHADFDPDRFSVQEANAPVVALPPAREGRAVRFQVQVVCVGEDGVEETHAVTDFTRGELVMENLGMTVAEGKAVLNGIQEYVTERQAADFLRRARPCERCGRSHSTKSGGTTIVRTAYGSVRLPNPRWHRCRCAPADSPRTFRPLQRWLRGTTSPELLYLESKWAALIPYGGVARLLGDVLPISDVNRERVRSDTLHTAERIEAQLGEEKELFFEGSEEDWERRPIPDGPPDRGYRRRVRQGRTQARLLRGDSRQERGRLPPRRRQPDPVEQVLQPGPDLR